MYSQKQRGLFAMNGFQYFLGCVIRLRQMELIVFIMFYLETNFPRKQTKLKDFFLSILLTGLMPSHAFANHDSSTGLHAYSTAVFASFIDNFSGNSLPIDTLVDTNRKSKVAENRKKLVSNSSSYNIFW